MRFVTEKEDLNRSFPGSPDGSMAERVADSIFQDTFFTRFPVIQPAISSPWTPATI